MDRAVGPREVAARATPAGLDDLGGDGDRGLLRRARAEVQPDRRVQALELGIGEPGLLQPDEAILMRPARAHGADVAGVGAQRDLQRRNVELRVVGEDRDDRPLVDMLLLEPAVRPVDDDLIGIGKRFAVAKIGRASHTVTR